MIRHGLEVVSFALLLAGLALSVAGTYLSTHLYHAYSFLNFLKAVGLAVGRTLQGNFARVLKTAEIAASQGEAEPEDRAKALIGLYLIFLGFVLQGVGTVLGLADVFMGMAEKAVPCAAGIFLLRAMR